MNCYLDLFTPETWDAFRRHGADISGFREKQRPSAEKIQPGDIFLCYLVRVSRWCGVLKISSPALEVPAGDDEVDVQELTHELTKEDVRESHKVQATIARIGAEMDFRIWVPRSDKQRLLDQLPKDVHPAFLEELPLNYDDNTLRTIEQIDVIWMRGRSMSRAFEVEHTTAIYSGLLRMADLLALQPNMDIRLHIVAPDDKREKVLREIKRPVFSLLDRGPLYENCS